MNITHENLKCLYENDKESIKYNQTSIKTKRTITNNNKSNKKRKIKKY